MKILRTLALICALVLTACGGGGSPQTTDPVNAVSPVAVQRVKVSYYGDSITRGDGLATRPVERRTEMSKGAFIGVDYSLGGSTVQDATAGDSRLPYQGKFVDWIKQDTSEIVVIGHIGANALRSADKLEEYDVLLTAMINQAKALGKTVVLSGMTWVAAPVMNVSDDDSVRILHALSDFEAQTRRIAIRENCMFLDLRSVPFNGAVDMMDNVHPNQSYSDRVSAYVVERLVALIRRVA